MAIPKTNIGKCIERCGNDRRVRKNDEQLLDALDLGTVSFLIGILGDEVHKCESAGRWAKARRLVWKWKTIFEKLPAGEMRDRCLEEWERRHFLLFHGEYVPVCVRTWARGKNLEDLQNEET
jgi:hypothetical protein